MPASETVCLATHLILQQGWPILFLEGWYPGCFMSSYSNSLDSIDQDRYPASAELADEGQFTLVLRPQPGHPSFIVPTDYFIK